MASAASRPKAADAAHCTAAPGMAMPFTSMRSSVLKWRPTPNMSRMMPASARLFARSASATKPGVSGPMRNPAARYPTMGDRRARCAR